MTIEFQYLKNKKTGRIKKAGFIDLSKYANEEDELIVGELPESYEIDEFPKSQSEIAEEILDKWAIYFQELAKQDARIVIAYEDESDRLEKALYNAGRVADLQKKGIDLTFVFYKINNLQKVEGIVNEQNYKRLKIN